MQQLSESSLDLSISQVDHKEVVELGNQVDRQEELLDKGEDRLDIEEDLHNIGQREDEVLVEGNHMAVVVVAEEDMDYK